MEQNLYRAVQEAQILPSRVLESFPTAFGNCAAWEPSTGRHPTLGHARFGSQEAARVRRGRWAGRELQREAENRAPRHLSRPEGTQTRPSRMQMLDAMSPVEQLQWVFVGGIVLTVILIFASRQLPSTPMSFGDDDPAETPAAGMDPPVALPASMSELEETGSGADAPGLRRRQVPAAHGRGEDVLTAEEIRTETAAMKLTDAVKARADAAVGAKQDPFDLSEHEAERLAALTSVLMPHMTEEQRKAELASATAAAREEWRAHGDKVFDSKGRSDPRALGRWLDALFVCAVLCFGGYILRTEYGWKPWESLEAYLPVEAAVLSGRAYTGERGFTDALLRWFGMGQARLE